MCGKIPYNASTQYNLLFFSCQEGVEKMPKKFSLADRKRWLEQYESGKSEIAISKENKCDTRTVKKGIEEARRELEAQTARTELLKQALLKHQETLLDRLQKILSTLTVPQKDWTPLSWHRGEDSIFSEGDLTVGRAQSHEAFGATVSTDERTDMVHAMLTQHLSGDKLWKILAQQERASAEHRLKRIAVQHKVVTLLEKETGYKMVDGDNDQPPFLYSHNTGDLFFKMTMRCAFGEYDSDDWQGRIVANKTAGNVLYQSGSILAEVPGNEETCRQKLLGAFGKMKSLPELVEVVATFGELKKATYRARQAIEEVLLLGLIPGHCKVCRRLGM